jgi:hypothetical protein
MPEYDGCADRTEDGNCRLHDDGLTRCWHVRQCPKGLSNRFQQKEEIIRKEREETR